MMNSVIAHLPIFGQRQGKERFEITVEIGTPYLFGDDPEERACPVAVRPLFKRLHAAHGGDSFQSLCLAIAMAQDLLQGIREKGGSLTYENGEQFLLNLIHSVFQRSRDEGRAPTTGSIGPQKASDCGFGEFII